MKLLQCELCGSNDLIKRDGLFVCEYCGAKYTVEEARNLFVDGPVSVKIDNNELYDNSIHLMKVALSETRYDDAYAAIQDALRIKPLSPYLQAMQAVAFFGREGVHGKIPLPASKGLESAKKAFDKETDIVAIRDYARDLRIYLPAAFQYVKDECNRKIKELRNLKDMTVPGIGFSAYAPNQQTSQPELALYKQQIEKQNKNINASISRIEADIRTARRFSDEWEKYANDLFEKNQKQINKQYWEEHEDDKLQLIQRKEHLAEEEKNLKEQIKELTEQEKNVPAAGKLKLLQDERTDLYTRRDTIPFFKIKEKKELENRLEEVKKQIENCLIEFEEEKKPYKEQENEIRDRISGIIKEIQDINDELTKDR